MKEKHLTTNQAVPISDNQNSLTVGERGPVLLQDVQFIEKMAHFDRERIPERVVHAKGAGHTVTSRFTRVWHRTRRRIFFKFQRKKPLYLSGFQRSPEDEVLQTPCGIHGVLL